MWDGALGIGCMRLSTEPDRDDPRAEAVLRAAIDAGVTVLDTADAYARDQDDIGHNERVIANVARRGVRVVTKGGLERPAGKWVPNGKAKHLASAARASRERLGVEALDVYLLHAVDPSVPLATSVRALAKLRDDGVVRAIGLSNIGPRQLAEALAITRIDVVEVELSPWKLDAVRGGLLRRCADADIAVLAHRPLGGPAGVTRIARDPMIAALARELDASPPQIVLAWLRTLGPSVIPLPGVTRVETAREAGRRIELPRSAIASLAERFGGIEPEPAAPVHGAVDGEVVLVMGAPGAGKSTLALELQRLGYVRLNRDERGGTLAELTRELARVLSTGATRVVLDNTYPTRSSRAAVIAAAHRHGIPARAVVLGTTLEQAQANAVRRMLQQHGRLLGPSELTAAAAIGPGAQFRWRRQWEPPEADEGWASIEERAFEPRPQPVTGRRAAFVELDDVVWRGRPRAPDAVVLHDGARAAVRGWREAGRLVCATTWQPDLTDTAYEAVVARLRGLLDVEGDRGFEIRRCDHPAGPPVCWCRKPLPGLALAFAHERGIDLGDSLCIGRGAADRGFAQRAGVPFHDVSSGWPA